MSLLGRLLIADLEQGRFTAAAIDEELARRFFVGRGFNSHYLYAEVAGQVDPLGPQNPLILSAGLLTGTEAPASSRLHVSARSPLTGLLGSSNVGGHFGAALRAAGWQAIVCLGKAAAPVALLIEAEQTSLVDAGDLWGLDAWQTQDALHERLGDDRSRIMAIGPAGEALVRYGCIMTERGHAAGRTGMGAVMGAKNLKAIVVRGRQPASRQAPAAHKAVQAYAKAICDAPRYLIYAKFSNTGYVTWADESGILATRNYHENRFEHADRIDGRRIIEYVTGPKGCHRCPVHCKAGVRIDEGPFAGTEGERPDIEPIVALGSKCGVGDAAAVLYLYNLCCRLGLDVISAASCLAFAMDLRERGILSAAETDGLDLVWGNVAAMAAMLQRIAHREGFGAILAEGVARAARLIGRGAEAAAFHSKGLELTAYDPRGGMGTALGYAVSPRGGDFTSVYAVPEYRWDAEQGRREFGSPRSVDRQSTEAKGLLVKRTLTVSAALDALGLCKVPALSVVGDFSLAAEAALAQALTGWPLHAADLLEVGERIVTVERLFNLRHGAGPGDDTLPALFRQRGLPYGPHAGATVDVEPMVRQFYQAMGWDDEGKPTPARLAELRLA